MLGLVTLIPDEQCYPIRIVAFEVDVQPITRDFAWILLTSLWLRTRIASFPPEGEQTDRTGALAAFQPAAGCRTQTAFLFLHDCFAAVRAGGQALPDDALSSFTAFRHRCAVSPEGG